MDANEHPANINAKSSSYVPDISNPCPGSCAKFLEQLGSYLGVES